MALLEGYTAQTRGQRFNGLLADMFRAWGHRARSDLNHRGNIDVAVAIGHQRFVLEAKWEDKPIVTGAISKLQKRVTQRLGGTIGVFVSMSGYTEDALVDVKDGQRLEVVLLDRGHVEAMLSGFCPPEELMKLMLDRGVFYGDSTCSLHDLLTIDEPPPHLQFANQTRYFGSERLVRSRSDNVGVDVMIREIPFDRGAVMQLPNRHLLLIGGEGLLIVDQHAGRVERMRGPSNITGAKILTSGDIAIIRNRSVALLRGSSLIPIGGPFAGDISFVKNTGDEIAVFVNGTRDRSAPLSGDLDPSVTILHDTFGTEERTPLDISPGSASGAVRTFDGRLLLVDESLTMFEDDEPVWTINQVKEVFAIAPIDDDRKVLCVGRNTYGTVILFLVNMDWSDEVEILCELELYGNAFDVVLEIGSTTVGYLFAADYKGGMIIQFDLDRPDETDEEYDEEED
jgi:hypothetical protein